jgi:hypothetical protein
MLIFMLGLGSCLGLGVGLQLVSVHATSLFLFMLLHCISTYIPLNLHKRMVRFASYFSYLLRLKVSRAVQIYAIICYAKHKIEKRSDRFKIMKKMLSVVRTNVITCRFRLRCFQFV